MPTNLILDNRVRILAESLSPELQTQLCSQFEHKNPQFLKLRAMNLPAWSEPPVIKTWKKKDGWLTFPRGGMSRVRDVLKLHGHQIVVTDNRTTGKVMEWPTPAKEMLLYGYQGEAVRICIEKQNCLLRAPTGSGKTRTGFAFAKELELPTLVVVWSAALFDQWKERAVSELGMRKADVGYIRGGKVKLRPLTIAMSQTLAKGVSDEVNDYFGVVIFDEVQRAAAKTMFESVDPFRAKYRLGISADQTRKDKKEFLIYDLFGKVAMDIKQKDLIESGHVMDVEIRVIPTNFRADWYGMNFHQTSFLEEPGDTKEIDFNRLLDEMTSSESRNKLIYDVVNVEVAAEQQVLVMSHRREHCLDLDRGLLERGTESGFLIGGDDYKVQFRQSIAKLKNWSLSVGVGTYAAIGQGLDLPAVGVAIATTPIGGNKQFFGQVRGRVCRISKGKTSARLYYLWDRHVYGSHLENLVRWNTSVVVFSHGQWVEAKEYIRQSA